MVILIHLIFTQFKHPNEYPQNMVNMLDDIIIFLITHSLQFIMNYIFILNNVIIKLGTYKFYSLVIRDFHWTGVPGYPRSFYQVYNCPLFLIIILCYFKPPYNLINHYNLF